MIYRKFTQEHIENIRYRAELDKLIPIAQRVARERVKELGKIEEPRIGAGSPIGAVNTYHHCFFTEFFHAEMNKLAYEAGLRPMIGGSR